MTIMMKLVTETELRQHWHTHTHYARSLESPYGPRQKQVHVKKPLFDNVCTMRNPLLPLLPVKKIKDDIGRGK